LAGAGGSSVAGTGAGNGGNAYGGVIFNSGALTIDGSEFLNNSVSGGSAGSSPIAGANGGDALGGAIDSEAAGTLSITNSSFDFNNADAASGADDQLLAIHGGNGGLSQGGALYNLSPAATLNNTNFANNLADGGSGGAGGGNLDGSSTD